jgi:hypothetical protein
MEEIINYIIENWHLINSFFENNFIKQQINVII